MNFVVTEASVTSAAKSIVVIRSSDINVTIVSTAEGLYAQLKAPAREAVTEVAILTAEIKTAVYVATDTIIGTVIGFIDTFVVISAVDTNVRCYIFHSWSRYGLR